MVFRKNGVVGFIVLRYMCHRHILDIFMLIFGRTKLHLKLAKKQYIQLELATKNFRKITEKLCFVTLVPKGKKILRIFSGKNSQMTIHPNVHVCTCNALHS